jgi:hypothetical protein
MSGARIGQPLQGPLKAHTGQVNAVELGVVDGRAVVSGERK